MITSTKSSILFAFFLIINIPLATPSQKPDLVIQAGHRNMIRALALDPDERLLASGGADKAILIWDLDLRKQVLSLKGHKAWISALTFSSDKKFLASGSYDGKVKVWNLNTAKIEFEISPLQSYNVNSLAFSHDSKILVIAGSDKVINVWDMESRTMKPPLTGHTSSVTQVLFHPLNDNLFSSSLDKTTRFWDLSTRKTEVLGKPLPLGITDLAFAPGGKIYALSSTGGGTIGVLDYSSGNDPRIIVIQPQTYKPSWPFIDYRRFRMAFKTSLYNGGSMVFISDKELAFADCFHLTIWDLVSDKKKFSVEIENGMGAYAVLYSEKRNLLIYNDGVDIKLLNTATQKTEELKGGSTMFTSATFTADGRSLAAIFSDGTGMWDDARKHKILNNEDKRILMAGFKSNKAVLLPSKNLLGIVDKQRPNDIVFKTLSANEVQFALKGHIENVKAITANNDETLLASSAGDGFIFFWDLRTHQVIKKMRAKGDFIQFSPDGKLFANADGAADTIKVWKVKNLEKELFTVKTQVLNEILFSPDSSTLAAVVEERQPATSPSEKKSPSEKDEVFSCRDSINTYVRTSRKLFLWNAETGTLLHTLDLKFIGEGFDSETFVSSKSNCEPYAYTFFSRLQSLLEMRSQIAFSKDSRLIAAARVNDATANNEIRIWTTSDGKEYSFSQGHDDSIRSLAFSPNGKILISASWDRTLKLWDSATGKELATFILFDKDNWVIYTPEGHFDTNLDLNEMDKLSWTWPEDPFYSLSAEVFMRDYYEPNLIGKILTAEPLSSVRDISNLNRTQPLINIKAIKPDGENTVQVTVEVTSVFSKTQRDATGKPLQSGAFDVTLYRDRQIVAGSVTEEGMADYTDKVKKLKNKTMFAEAKREIWRQTHKISLDQNHKAVLTFKNIPIPQRRGVKNVNFSAFVHNNDEVRSEPAVYKYNIGAPPRQTKQASAYIITVGVDANQSGINWNLDLAVKSASDMQRLLNGRLSKSHRVVNIPLVSSFEENSPRVGLKVATKENIKTVLDLLAGKSVNKDQYKDIPNVEAVSKALPDDMVFLYIASHGYQDPQGNFYIIPFNTGRNYEVSETTLNRCLADPGYSLDCGSEKDFIEKAISGNDLTAWWRGVDAGQIVMILDSCYSASIVPGKDFKPGPWGDRNFAQLSYNKGMMLLAASEKVAFSVSRNTIRGTLLSKALISVLNKDPQQDLEYWLEETKHAVPEQYKNLYPQGNEDGMQFPALFNFSKRKH